MGFVSSGRIETARDKHARCRSDQPGSVTAFRYRGRSAKESFFCLDLLQARAHGTKPYGRPQQRIMQNRDDVGRLTASAVEALHGAPRG